MKIISLEADSFKRLTAVAITPTTNVVEISGDNGEGKSSTLDAIWAALGGKDAAPAKPIHTGADKAEIRLVLGEGGEPKLKVTRRFKHKEGAPYTTDLIVESAEGARFASPQGILDALVGELCFDPLAFTRLKDAEQIEALRRFVPDVDFAKIEGLNKRDYEDRTDLNRQAKQLRAQIAALPLPQADAPAPVRVNTAALEVQLADAARHNADVATRKAAREQAKDRIEVIRAEIMRLQEEQTGLENRLKEAGPPPEPIDVADVQQRLSEGRMANAAADVADRRFQLEQEAEGVEAQATTRTEAIAKRTAEAQEAVQKADMPIPGLGFGDGFVTLNGEPFSQASQAQKIRASVAIAAAMNPKLRVARILDGSLLDRHSWASLEAYAAEHDLQIWVESIEPRSAAAVVIEDGGVRGAQAAPTNTPDEDVI